MTGRAVQRHRLALLALLAAVPAGVARDRLVALLWPDASPVQGRKLLSDSIYRINQEGDADLIESMGDQLRLDPGAHACDLRAFREAMGEGRWEDAIRLYRGPFLDGFFLPGAVDFDQWMESERERLAREHHRALERHAEEAEAEGEPVRAAKAWEAVAVADPYNSRVACRLMEALDRAGERARAVRHGRIHVALMQELGLEPESRVLELAEEIRLRPEGLQIPATEEDPAAEIEARSTGPGSVGGERERSGGGPPPPAPPQGTPAPGSTLAPSVRRGADSGVPIRRRRAMAMALATFVLLVLAGLALAFRVSVGPEAGSVAVLPFHDLSPGGDHEYFSDGLTEELMDRLARIEGLRVAARTSSFAFKDRHLDVREVGRHLGVAAVVEGSVRMVGDRLRITAQLVSTEDGYQLWAGAYDRTLDDVFAVQADIARAIASALGGRLVGEVELGAPETALVDPEAYDLYLRGRFFWHRRTEHDLRAAADHFDEAVRRSPGYVPAWVGLGDAYGVLGFYDYVAPVEAFPRAETAARRALALDPENAAARATLGYAALYYRWDAGRAEAEFRQAIALDPRYSTGHQWYANLLTAAGRFPEAEASMRRAQELDPLSLIANAALGWVRYFAGRHEEALEQLRRTRELDPDFELAYLWSGWALEGMGRYDEGLVALLEAERRSGGSGVSRASVARLRAIRGDTAEAVRILTELETSGLYVPSYELGKVHLALGDSDQAIEWLERAFHERSHSLVFLAVDPQLEGLREDPRFQSLLQRVGFVE